MKTNEIHRTTTSDIGEKTLATGNDGAALREGILATFDGTLTTSTEDRDGDVLEAKGANLDPRMPLLFNHSTAHPVGKFLSVVSRDNDGVVGKFAIVDSDLGRDVLKLIKMGALRLSIGFKPAEFEPRKGGKGFLVTQFEIVETSLVAVPANREAIITALQEKKFLSPDFIKSLTNEDVPMPKPTTTTTPTEPIATKTFTEDDVQKIVGKALEDFAKTETPKPTGGTTPTPGDVLGAAAKGNNGGIVVKGASEQYSNTKTTGRHCKTGEAIRDEYGREAQTVSQRDSVKAGVFLKNLASRAGIGQASLNEHERELLEDCYKNDKWCGKIGAKFASGIEGSRVKALLNDSVSGGAEVVPIFFDENLISFPLLSGELFPFIDLRPISRGSSVEGASVGNPTMIWGSGSAEGTEIAIFDTTALIAAINSSIFPVTVALEVGREFLADSPADVGRILTENIGQKLAAELDRVTADGNGTSEPEGILNASGVSSLNSDNDTTGPPTLADYESLLFGVGKQYRSPSMRCAFLSNDTSYQRRTGIKIDTADPSTDQRPVFGMYHNDYMTLGWPHRIQNDIGNSEIAFGALSKYRMYRRMGMEIRWVDGGKELARRNAALLIVRARFGGQVMDANAFAKMADAQS